MVVVIVVVAALAVAAGSRGQWSRILASGKRHAARGSTNTEDLLGPSLLRVIRAAPFGPPSSACGPSARRASPSQCGVGRHARLGACRWQTPRAVADGRGSILEMVLTRHILRYLQISANASLASAASCSEVVCTNSSRSDRSLGLAVGAAG